MQPPSHQVILPNMHVATGTGSVWNNYGNQIVPPLGSTVLPTSGHEKTRFAIRACEPSYTCRAHPISKPHQFYEPRQIGRPFIIVGPSQIPEPVNIEGAFQVAQLQQFYQARGPSQTIEPCHLNGPYHMRGTHVTHGLHLYGPHHSQGHNKAFRVIGSSQMGGAQEENRPRYVIGPHQVSGSYSTNGSREVHGFHHVNGPQEVNCVFQVNGLYQFNGPQQINGLRHVNGSFQVNGPREVNCSCQVNGSFQVNGSCKASEQQELDGLHQVNGPHQVSGPQVYGPYQINRPLQMNKPFQMAIPRQAIETPPSTTFSLADAKQQLDRISRFWRSRSYRSSKGKTRVRKYAVSKARARKSCSNRETHAMSSLNSKTQVLESSNTRTHGSSESHSMETRSVFPKNRRRRRANPGPSDQSHHNEQYLPIGRSGVAIKNPYSTTSSSICDSWSSVEYETYSPPMKRAPRSRYQKYTNDHIRFVLQQVLHRSKSIYAVALENGINPRTAQNWVRRHKISLEPVSDLDENEHLEIQDIIPFLVLKTKTDDPETTTRPESEPKIRRKEFHLT